jgi:hypothetical protein
VTGLSGTVVAVGSTDRSAASAAGGWHKRIENIGNIIASPSA